jgi:hypothetical protein
MSEQTATVDGLMALVEQFGAYRWGTGVAEESKRVVLAANEDERAVGVRDAIRAYAERLAASPAVQAVPTWIPVSERLPSIGQHVAALIYPYANPRNRQIAVAALYYSEGEFLDDDGKAIHTPTHWTPLPPISDDPAAPIQRPGDHLQGGAS